MIEANRIFDVWSIVSNEIIGDVWLTVFIFAIGIILGTVRLKMPFELQFIFLVLMLAAMFSKTLMLIIWVFTVLAVGLVAYWALSKIMGG